MIEHGGSKQQSDAIDVAAPNHEAQDYVGHDSEETGGEAAWAQMQQHALARTLHGGPTLRERLTTPRVDLPHRARLEQSFGEPLSGIEAHVGEGDALRDLGGLAAADGNLVAFAERAPSLETVAHEVTHVLQARSGRTEGGAEAEAGHVEAQVAAGQSVGPLTQGAAGIHFKADAPALTTAREFVASTTSVQVTALHTLFLNKSVASHPFGRYLQTPEAFLDAMFMYGSPGLALITPFADKIPPLVAPEPFTKLVDDARRADVPAGGTNVGPAHYVYADSVGFALGNALTRRLRESLTRMLPRYVAASGVERNRDGSLFASKLPQAQTLVPSHPIDRVVALGLCGSQVKVDAEKFAGDHPELVKGADRKQSRSVTVRLPWERNLWHWVEATPADATAEEVAEAVFGNTDQAYRLTAMPPLFGFRASDVASFRKELRVELNALAAQHHPNPEVLNWIDIAQYDAEKDRRDRETNPWRNGTYGGDAMDGGVPIAGVPPQPTNEPDPNRPKEQLGYPSQDVDPAVELAAAMGDKYARDRAKAQSDGKHHDQAEVYDIADNCLESLAGAEKAFAALGLDTRGIERYRAEFHRQQTSAKNECLADPDGMYALAAAQFKLLKRITKGANDTAGHLVLFGGVSQGASVLPTPNELPPPAREPVVDAANAYSAALDALSLPELAMPRVDHAESLSRTLRISILENSLHESEPTLEDAIDSPDDRHKDGATYDPEQKRSENNTLLAELSVLRVEMESDPAAAEKQLANTQSRGGDYLFEMSVISNFEALDRIWKVVHDQHDFWESMGDAFNGARLEARNREYYATFKGIYERFEKASKAKDDTAKQTARTDFKNLVQSDEFKNHFKEVKEHLQDEASHKKWAKIITAIAISVVAMGLGQMWFAAVLAETESVVLALAVGATVETTTNAVLSKLILDVDPTAGSLITGFVGAAAMYGMIGRTLAAGRAAGMAGEVGEAAERATFLQKAGTLAVDTTKEVLLVQAIGMLQGEVANLIDHGTVLSEEQLSEMFVHNLAGLVGMKIGQRVIDVHLDPMAPLRDVGSRQGIDIAGLLQDQKDLSDLAKQVEHTRDPALAQTLIERERAFLEKERQVREALIEYAKKHPGKVSAAKLRDLKAMPEHGADPEVVKAQALMSVEEVAPGYYRADARAFDAVIAMHKESGSRLVDVRTDPTTGLRSITFETPDGVQLRIKEKLGEQAERTGPAVPVEQARAFEHWLDHEATTMMESTAVDRMREYYARDPQAAVKLAGERYGYGAASIDGTAAPFETHPAPGVEHPTAKSDATDASRAYEQYAYEQSTKRQDHPGDPPAMDRTDFESMYKAGYEHDPVSGRWILGEKAMATPSGSLGGKLPASETQSQVIGTLHSEAVGEQALRKLVAGEAEALRMVGIEPPKGFDPRTNEWGLGRRTSDGAIVLVRGAKGEVNWSHVPGIEPLAHSHPLIDPNRGFVRTIRGKRGDGMIDASSGLSLAASATHEDLVYFVPSTGDLRHVALDGSPHKVMTPFAHLGEGRVGNPSPGMNADTVDIHIVSAEAVGLLGEMVVYKGKVRVMAGDHEIGSYDIYQVFHEQIGDLPSVVKPAGTVDLPANHPIKKLDTTPSSRTDPMGHVPASTVRHLMALGIDESNPGLVEMLSNLDADTAGHLASLAERALEGRVEGFADWIKNAQEQNGKALRHAELDLEAASRALESDPSAKVRFTPDGKLHFVDEPKVVTPQAPGDPATLVKEVRDQVAGEKPEEFEWKWSDADALRVVAEGRKLNLTDTQIRDLIRIAQRKDRVIDGKLVRKQITPDEMIQQMHNYIEVVIPQEHPYRIDSKADFNEFADKLRSEVAKAGLPTDDIRVQGSALRKPDAKDIDLAVLIDDRAFDAQLIKVFEGKVTHDGREVPLRIEDLPELVADIRRDESVGKRYNSTARTLMYAYEHRTIRVQEFPSLNRAKKSLQKAYGDLDITIMSNSGYLNREPFMVLP